MSTDETPPTLNELGWHGLFYDLLSAIDERKDWLSPIARITLEIGVYEAFQQARYGKNWASSAPSSGTARKPGTSTKPRTSRSRRSPRHGKDTSPETKPGD